MSRKIQRHKGNPGVSSKWVILILPLMSIAAIFFFVGRGNQHPVLPSKSNLAEPSNSSYNQLGSPWLQQRGFSNPPAFGRTVYPFSVIVGGIADADDLRSSLAKDRVAAIHFSDFDIAHARIVRLNTDKIAYVSYRMNNQIYWTRKRIKLTKGEFLVTDGKTMPEPAALTESLMNGKPQCRHNSHPN